MTETLLYILGILAVAVGIGFSIGLHELGHLIPAKIFGVKVPKYMIGFGPTLFSFRRGETEYGVKVIPLGGYITMIGMYPPAKPGKKRPKGFFGDMINSAREAGEDQVGPGDQNRKFYQLPVLKRITIMFGGPLMNLVLGTVLMVVALTGIGVVQRSMTVAEVSECVPATTAPNSTCGPSDPASPALAAGVKPGDKIIAIGGVSVTNWNLLLEDLSPGVASELTLLRDGKEIQLSITPVEALRPDVDPKSGSVIVDSEGQPVLVPKPVLGVILASERQPVPLSASLEASASGVAQVGAMILTLPQQLTDVAVSTFTGESRNPNGAVSVVGIGQIAGEVASSESASLIDKASTGLLIIASLNFALFAFNMLPLLPLDGGHIAGGVYESIKRGAYRVLRKPDPGPADTALLMPATWAVFILLIGMSLLLITADFINPIAF